MNEDFNKVLLKGRVACEIIPCQVGTTSVLNFSLAVNRIYTKSDGSRVDEVTYVPIEAWGVVADSMCNRIDKGSTVFIDGRLKLDRWELPDGQKKSKLKIIVENYKFIHKGKTNEDNRMD